MRPEIAKIYNGQCDEVGKERETGLRGASGVSVSTNITAASTRGGGGEM